MSIGHALLGLLETGPRHGYDRKRAYDERFGHDRPLPYGQVYSTLSRLLRNGLVEVSG
ncbi:MAG TPA: PadR family transcriptional regulator, partial [Pseudonocardiaceae bacterium]|nr:PadR family transcriptional regulator [Pseudonocardiaceae bacterium]